MQTVNCKNIVLSILFGQIFSGIIKLVGGLWLTVCLFAWFTKVLRYQYEQCVGSSTLHILYYMRKGCEAGPVVYHSCPRRLEIESRYRRISLRNQPTFGHGTSGFPGEMTSEQQTQKFYWYWWRVTTQIWVTRHKYGISAVCPQLSETSDGVSKCRGPSSQAIERTF